MLSNLLVLEGTEVWPGPEDTCPAGWAGVWKLRGGGQQFMEHLGATNRNAFTLLQCVGFFPHPALSMGRCYFSPELLNIVANIGQIWWCCRGFQPAVLWQQRDSKKRWQRHPAWSEAGVSLDLELGSLNATVPAERLLNLQLLHQNQKFWHLINSAWLTWCPVACFAELLSKRQNCFRF